MDYLADNVQLVIAISVTYLLFSLLLFFLKALYNYKRNEVIMNYFDS